MQHARINATLWVGLILALPASAGAGGFTIPGQGTRSMSRGAAFVALSDDLTALMVNPGGLSKLTGTHFLYNHNFINNQTTFTRFPTSMEVPADSVNAADPTAPVDNQKSWFPLGAAIGLASDFGLEDWTFALGVYGPNAVGSQEYSPDGGNRYMLTEAEIILIYYTLGVAYGHKDTFGVGLTLQYVHMPVTTFGQVVDGTTGAAPTPYYSSSDLIATLDMKDDAAFTAQIGAWFRPIPQIEIGLSARVVPIFLNPSGEVVLSKVPGQDFLGNANSEVTLHGGDASLDITMPIIVRSGIRYRHLSGDREVFDLELDFVYEAWSSLERYDIDLEGDVEVTLPGLPADQQPPTTALTDLRLEKRWKDTYSLRFGGTWNAWSDILSVSAGGFWETGAAPNQYSHLDFPAFDRYGVGGGLRVRGYGIDFSIAYMHVFQETREVDELYGKVFQQRPLAPCPDSCGKTDNFPGITGVPANSGKFQTSYNQIQISLGLHFDEWF